MTDQVTDWISGQIDLAADNMDESIVDSPDWVNWNSRKSTLKSVADVIDRGVDWTWLQTERDKAKRLAEYHDPNSDLDIAWTARLVALNDCYEVLLDDKKRLYIDLHKERLESKKG